MQGWSSDTSRCIDCSVASDIRLGGHQDSGLEQDQTFEPNEKEGSCYQNLSWRGRAEFELS